MAPYNFAQARKNMVENEIRPCDITDPELIEVLGMLPRERFVPEDKRSIAYCALPVEIAPGRFLLDPCTLAKLLRAADVKKTSLVLDIGVGTGYSTAVLAGLAETVVGLEEDPALAAFAEDALKHVGADNGVIVEGNMVAGAPNQGPFDVIVLNGMVDVLPSALTDQIKEGGRLVVLQSEGAIGHAMVYERIDNVICSRQVFDGFAPVLPGFEREPAFVL